MRMSASTGGELAAWAQVMFVAPGLLQQAVLRDEQVQQAVAAKAAGDKEKETAKK